MYRFIIFEHAKITNLCRKCILTSSAFFLALDIADIRLLFRVATRSLCSKIFLHRGGRLCLLVFGCPKAFTLKCWKFSPVSLSLSSVLKFSLFVNGNVEGGNSISVEYIFLKKQKCVLLMLTN